MLNNFSSKCIKMTKRCAFGTSYSITYFNSGIKVRPSLGKACTNLCHVFGFVISTPGQGQQLLTGLFKKMVRRSTSSKGVKHVLTLNNAEKIEGYGEKDRKRMFTLQYAEYRTSQTSPGRLCKENVLTLW